MKRALILGGGALRGAFQAGVVSALDRAGVRFDVIAGTSVGAVNGAALLHGYGPDLVEMWRENLRNVRWFDRRRLLRGRSPFLISEAMRLMVERYGDFARIRAHPSELLVSVTDWETGANVLFSSKDDGPGWTDEERTLHFLASLTIPLLSSEPIVIRGRRYCDGGLSNNFPIAAALARGCRELIVVDPSPPGPRAGAAARTLAPLVPHLRALPVPLARLAAGWIGEALSHAPREVAGATLRLVTPPEDVLAMSGLDFGRQRGLDRALDVGVEAGKRLAEEMLAGRYLAPSRSSSY